MFLILQFPVADARAFSGQAQRLARPTWPHPHEGQYLRSTGRIERRGRGGLNNWVGEARVCRAGHAIRFSGSRQDFIVNAALRLRPRFRRFFFDGDLAGKFEIGIQVECSDAELKLDKEDFRQVLDRLFSLPVRVPAATGAKSLTLLCAGPALAALYAQASAAGPKTAALQALPGLIAAGPPLLFVEAKAGDRIAVPFREERISETAGAATRLSHFWLTRNRGAEPSVRCWFMQVATDRQQAARELRIALLRLNASRFGLEFLFEALVGEQLTVAPRSLASERLQHFLNNTVPRQLQVLPGPQDAALLRIACQSESRILNGEPEALLGKLRDEIDIRRQVFGKTQALLDQIGGLVREDRIFIQELIVGDKYEAGQVGAQGPHATAHSMTFNQVWLQNKDRLDLPKLGEELGTLVRALQSNATESGHFVEMGAIAAAEIEARKGNGERVLEALSRAGKWSLDVAEKIGVGVATAALKSALGF